MKHAKAWRQLQDELDKLKPPAGVHPVPQQSAVSPVN